MLSKIYRNIPHTDKNIEIIIIYWKPVHQKGNKAENGIKKGEYMEERWPKSKDGI